MNAQHDAVNHPKHYTNHPSGVEAIVVARGMPFNLGNAFKYVFRAGSKGDAIEDLKKARWYLDDQIKLDIDTPLKGRGDGFRDYARMCEGLMQILYTESNPARAEFYGALKMYVDTGSCTYLVRAIDCIDVLIDRMENPRA